MKIKYDSGEQEKTIRAKSWKPKKCADFAAPSSDCVCVRTDAKWAVWNEKVRSTAKMWAQTFPSELDNWNELNEQMKLNVLEVGNGRWQQQNLTLREKSTALFNLLLLLYDSNDLLSDHPFPPFNGLLMNNINTS